MGKSVHNSTDPHDMLSVSGRLFLANVLNGRLGRSKPSPAISSCQCNPTLSSSVVSQLTHNILRQYATRGRDFGGRGGARNSRDSFRGARAEVGGRGRGGRSRDAGDRPFRERSERPSDRYNSSSSPQSRPRGSRFSRPESRDGGDRSFRDRSERSSGRYNSSPSSQSRPRGSRFSRPESRDGGDRSFRDRENSSSSSESRPRGSRFSRPESRGPPAPRRRIYKDSTLDYVDRDPPRVQSAVEGDNVKYLKPRSRPQFSIQDSHKKDRAEGERLAKRIARCGVSSRRDAEELIRSGAVTVDGSIVTTPAINVQPGSVITVNGELIKAEKPRLLIYNKPAGVVVQNLRPGDVDRPEARSLGTILTELDLRSFKAVGRLDINTEGLLLLTNDGELKRHLELPISELEREYRVRVFGEIDENKLAKLKDGVEIDGFQYRGCKVTVDKQKGANAWLTIMLKEGKNREIKVIMEALGLKVSRLIRVRFGPYELDPKDLPEGDIQEISISREHQRHTDPTWRWGEKDEEPQRFRARTAKSQNGGSDGPRRSRSPTREAAAPGNESGDKSWPSRP